MRQFFISLFASVIGFFVALLLLFMLMIALIAAVASSASSKKPLGKSVVLTLDLRRPMLDHSTGASLFGSQKGSLVQTVRALHAAKEDTKVKGVLIRANGWGMSPEQAEEIRLAIRDFKTSGKFVIAQAQGFEGTTLSGYMAVAPADEIWMQDTTGFALAGQRTEVEFLGGVFKKFDAKPEFIQFYEYKNAANTYTQDHMTPPHRESLTSLLQSIFDSSVANITEDRKLDKDRFLKFLDAAPHSAEQAKAQGFIDKFGYWVDAKDYARKKAGKDAEFLDISDYDIREGKGPVIAFIGGQGDIVPGGSEDGGNPFSSKVSMGSDTLSNALITASKDKNVKAILFRVNSPGGSASASDQIWDAVRKAKKSGKPVVVSMGQYAASGGYYVSAPADKIIAMPTTITGSIGVLGGVINIRGTAAKVGYNVEAVNIGGDFSSAYSAFEPWNQATREAMRASMEDIYVDFTSRVAEGRKMPIEEVRKIARGRVWTGVQAKENGLVDEIGGFMKALEETKKLAKIDKDTKVRLKRFPPERSQWEQLELMLSASAQASQNLQQLKALSESPEYQAFLKAQATLKDNGKVRLKAELPVLK